jgi:hypothetical protein
VVLRASERSIAMRRAQLLRISITLATVFATVLAGGASVKGF